MFEQFQMNDYHPMLLAIDPKNRLTKEDSVPEAEEHPLK
jgi:hypothetical protein